MIVRDEAAMLPDLLGSVAGLWDELIAVDTGSTDGTRALLAAAGATLVDFVWCDDFAAARNAGLAHATGDWILCLDADERVSPALAAQIRGLLDDPAAGAATVLLRDELPHGHVRECRLLRLFRNDPAIRFEHRIHEDLSRGVQAHLERSGRTLRGLDGVLHHLGYARAVAAARDKRTRDVTLLRTCILDDPHDWYSRHKLLEQARFWSDDALLRAAAADADAALRAAGPAALRGLPYAGEFLTLLARGLHDDPRAQLDYLERHACLAGRSAEFLLRRGELLELLGDPDGAAAAYALCRDEGVSPTGQLATVRPLLGLCRLAAAAGDLGEATRLAGLALDEAPRDPEALLAALAFAGAVGRRDAVLADYRARHGDGPELQAALGACALDEGRWPDAVAHLERAAGAPPRGRPALDLARARLAAGDLDGARGLAAALIPELPEAALGAVLCDLCVGRELDVDVDLEPAAAGTALRAWLDVLWRSRRTDWMGAVADAAPALAGVFPWLPADLRARTDALLGR